MKLARTVTIEYQSPFYPLLTSPGKRGRNQRRLRHRDFPSHLANQAYTMSTLGISRHINQLRAILFGVIIRLRAK